MIITVPTTWDQTTTIPTSKQKVHTDINNLKKNVSVGNGKRFYLSSIECLYGCFVVLKNYSCNSIFCYSSFLEKKKKGLLWV